MRDFSSASHGLFISPPYCSRSARNGCPARRYPARTGMADWWLTSREEESEVLESSLEDRPRHLGSTSRSRQKGLVLARRLSTTKRICPRKTALPWIAPLLPTARRGAERAPGRGSSLRTTTRSRSPDLTSYLLRTLPCWRDAPTPTKRCGASASTSR